MTLGRGKVLSSFITMIRKRRLFVSHRCLFPGVKWEKSADTHEGNITE